VRRKLKGGGVELVDCSKAPEGLHNEFHFLGKISIYKTLKGLGFFLGGLYILFSVH